MLDNIAMELVKQMSSCPGLVSGISGTDSIISTIVMDLVAKELKIPHIVFHFSSPLKDDDIEKKKAKLSPSFRYFEKNISFIESICPNIELIIKRENFSDAFRWAFLMDYALSPAHKKDDEGHKAYWLYGSRNKTEDELGLYSNMSSCVSIQPIISLYKSDIMKLCKDLHVPDVIMEKSRMADCDCGRYDLASNHIEEIDTLLKGKQICDKNLEKTLLSFIEEQKRINGFKKNIPMKGKR